MKRQKVLRFILILIVSVLWVFAFQVFGQEKSKEAGGFTIARLVVGTGVEKSEPVGSAETSLHRKGLLLLRSDQYC